MKNEKWPKVQQDVSLEISIATGSQKVLWQWWHLSGPLKTTRESVIKRRQEKVMMSGKGKRQKAEIMNSSRVMTSKEEVVDLSSMEQALRTKHGASWASEYFQGEDW